MTRKIHVSLGSRRLPVGTLLFDERYPKETHFAYCDSYLTTHDGPRFAISPDLPLRSGWQTVRQGVRSSPCPLSISDTEPGAWSLRVLDRLWAKGHSTRADSDTSTPSVIDQLLAVDDFSRMGALRFSDEQTPLPAERAARLQTPTTRDLPTLFRACRRIELDRETEEDLLYLEGRGTSLGGARPKCSVINRAGRLCLAKFDSLADQRDIAKGEVLALTLARLCGLQAANAERCSIDGVSASIIERFDRDAACEKRIPYLSASAFLMRTEEDDPPASYLDLLEALINQGADWRATAEELLRRILFNVLINNTDDHSRNTGLLMTGSQTWTLSPAFDINPVPLKRPSSPYASKLYLLDDEPAESITQIIDRADYFGLNAKEALKLLQPMIPILTDWRRIAKSPAIGMTTTDLNAYTLAFEHDRIAEAKALLARAGF